MKRIMSDITEMINIEAACETARDMCQKVMEKELEFEDPIKAMTDLEEALQIIRGMHHRGEFSDPESFLGMVSTVMGIYAGELMLQLSLAEKGFAWADTENYPLPVLKQGTNGTEVNPISTVWKKLWNAESETDGEGSIFMLYIIACGLTNLL